MDAIARDLIAAEGLGDFSAMGSATDSGWRCTSCPRLRPESDDCSRRERRLTVEPGIYHPGLGGIRIEDLVIVDADGPHVLTTFTKELVTVS